MTLIAPRRRSARIGLPKVAILAAMGSDREAGPLTEIGGRPVLWHTMMQLAACGMHDFLIASDDSVPAACRRGLPHEDSVVRTVSLGTCLNALQDAFANGPLVLSESSGLSDIDFDDLLSFHRSHGLLATIVAVRPPARFGRLEIDCGQVLDFAEKPAFEQGWVGAGIYVLEPGGAGYLAEAGERGLQGALALLAQDGQLMAYKHNSFWGSVETLKDRQELEKLWQSGDAPWKTWE